MDFLTQTNLGGGGRLGNCLFSMASLLGTSKKLNIPCVIPEWTYSKYFKNHLVTNNLTPTHHYHEPYFHYTPVDLGEALSTIEVKDKVYDLKGYFQSWRYWEGYEKEVKELFEPSDEFARKLRQLFNLHVGWHSGTTCSIHVRRGDYVGNSFYAQIGMGYYLEAIQKIESFIKIDKFLIFSDDIKWCKNMFSPLYSLNKRLIFIEGNTDIEDLFLQSFCDHQIICNSSFSWWSAYLNKNPDKIVIAPKKWFGENSALNTKDLYTNDMILI